MHPRHSLLVFFGLLKNIYRMLALAWQADKKLTTIYYLTAALSALAPLGISLSAKYLIDTLTLHQGSWTSPAVTLIIFLLAIRYLSPFVENVLYWTFNTSYLDYLFRYKVQNELNFRFYSKMAVLDVAYFENSKTQDLITKTRDTMLWRPPNMLRTFCYVFRSLVMMLSAAIVLATFNWWLPIVIIFASIPRLILQTMLSDIEWSIYGAGAPQARKLWYFSWILADPTALKEIKIFQAGNYLLNRLKSIQTNLLNLNKKPLDQNLRVMLLLPVLETGLVFFLAYSNLPLVFSGLITIGSFTLLTDMLLQLQGNVAQISGQMGEIYGNNLYVNDYFTVQSLPPLISEAPTPIPINAKIPPKIEFSHVSFAYPGGKVILNDISFTINPGENIALVGPNGAGKSTIIKLLCRFYDVTSGEILINGVNIQQINRSNLYQLMGTLFQEFMHYHLTVRENIIFGDSSIKIDRKKMVTAAKQSGAFEFIDKLPNRFDQILGKEYTDGAEISGGQWQKLAIARAFYEQAPLLILDEPTSAIDAEAEFEIFSNLQKVYRDKTLVLVSHRFSTVRNANRIYVIENGSIIEQGSHPELLALKGRYATMFTLQAKGYQV